MRLEPNHQEESHAPYEALSSLPLSAKDRNDSHDYGKYCRPDLRELLDILRLDIAYTRASGDLLFYETEEGECSILDMVGGYGSNILGHYHPRLKRRYLELLQEQRPWFVQGSVKPYATALSKQLNAMLQAGSPDPVPHYLLHLCSTGTEAVEAATLHANLSWQKKKVQHMIWVEKMLGQIPPHDPRRADAVSYLEELRNMQPFTVAMQGSFHGKTEGSLKITHNNAFLKLHLPRDPQVLFMNKVREEIEAYLLQHTRYGFNQVSGVILELLQCEGGVKEMNRAFVKALAETCARHDVPLLVDEIQTGCFRTGQFLLSQEYGINPDIIIIGKALGGGISKIAACLIQEDKLVENFGVFRTSTFGEDEVSSALACETMALLDMEREKISQRADHFELSIRNALSRLALTYPGVIKEVRGRGFILGIEFDGDLNGQAPQLLAAMHHSGYLGYFFASYLLHHHHLRLMPSVSNPAVLRLEPSVHISDDQIDWVIRALSDLVKKLSEGKLLALTSQLWRKDRLYFDSSVESPRVLRLSKEDASQYTKASFLCHFIDEENIKSFDPAIAELSFEERAQFLDRYGPMSQAINYHEQIITGSNGQKILIRLQGLTCGSRFFEQSLRNQDRVALEKVQDALKASLEEGARYIGLGQYTSIVSHNGLSLAAPNAIVTTGNSLTVGLAYKALIREVEERGLDPKALKISVVGAAGNIGQTLSELCAQVFGHVQLLTRRSREDDSSFAQFFDYLREKYPNLESLEATTDHHELYDSDILIVATNSTSRFISAAGLKKNAIVLDVSVPSNLDHESLKNREDVAFFLGGFAKLPLGQELSCGLSTCPPGEIYACMAETISLALAGATKSPSLGKLSAESVAEALRIAESVGITLGSLKKIKFF